MTKAKTKIRMDSGGHFNGETFIPFGVVSIVRGPYAGEIGYYDDWDDESRIPTGLIYFDGPPTITAYALVPLRSLAVASQEERDWWLSDNCNDLEWQRAVNAIRAQP